MSYHASSAQVLASFALCVKISANRGTSSGAAFSLPLLLWIVQKWSQAQRSHQVTWLSCVLHLCFADTVAVREGNDWKVNVQSTFFHPEMIEIHRETP